MSHPSSSWTLEVDTTPTPGRSRSLETNDPPIDIALDNDGDLLVDSDLHLTSGIDAVTQAIRIRLQTFTEEWFLDQTAGVDYYGVILGQKYDATRVRGEIRRVLASAPGVLSIDVLEVTFDGTTRIATVNWEVKSDFGTIQDTLTLGG